MSRTEVDWQLHLQERYCYEATLALENFLAGKVERIFIERLLALLYTYTAVPRVEELPCLADESMLLLARAIAGHLIAMGYWQPLLLLWPQLCQIAQYSTDPIMYVVLFKHLALVKGRQSTEAGMLVYQQLIADKRFTHVQPQLQVDILVNYATNLLWHGKPTRAEPLLLHCLALTALGATQSEESYVKDRHGLRLGDWLATLWELRAYALNQLGVLQMFSGNFVAAQQCFDECLALLVAHDEVDNLACVAYQSSGRLLLYQRRYATALPILESGLTIRNRWQDAEGIAVNSIYLAAAQLKLKNFSQAERLLHKAIALCRELDNTHDFALCQLYLGELAFQRRQYAQARIHWRDVTTIATQVILHFVELRPWLRYLFPLLLRGEFVLCWLIIATLWRSTRHDQLSLRALWRFLWV